MTSVLDMLDALLDKERGGLKQNELADRLGVSQPTVSRWLVGSDPRGEHRDAIKSLYREIIGEQIPSTDDDEIGRLARAIRAAPKPVQDRIINVIKTLLATP